MILTILGITYLRLRNNPVELLLVFVMPVAFFSIFAAIFSNGITTGSEKKLRVGWIAQRQTQLGSQLKAFLEKNSALECLSLVTQSYLTDVALTGDSLPIRDSSAKDTIANAQRSGRYDLIVRLPLHFPETITDDDSQEPYPIHLVTDGQNPMALAMVTSIINGFAAQNQAARISKRLNSDFPAQPRTGGAPSSSKGELRLASKLNDLHVAAKSLSQNPLQRFGGEGSGSDSTKLDRQQLIVPLTEPLQIILRGTRYLDATRKPSGIFLNDLNKNWPKNDADRLSATSEAAYSGTALSTDRQLNTDDELEQTIGRAVRFLNSRFGSSLYLTNDWGQRWLEEEIPREFSAESATTGAASKSTAQPPSNPTLEAMSEPIHVSQSLAADRDVFQITVDNPQSALQENPRIAMYAAGIAVLFLLFSSTGSAATLLEEAESGTLDRIMLGKASLFHILLGKWLGIFLIGMVQISVMFLWAELVFRIQLWKHLDGFFVMTCCTSAATASLAMLMATLCRSRAQLNAISVVLILSMSALGGSMIPRFAMSDRMKEIGQWTFNAWALDGYQKVFWYQAPIPSLINEVTVLSGSALVMGCLALLFSRRWKFA